MKERDVLVMRDVEKHESFSQEWFQTSFGKIKIKQAIIVEGKYDKLKLESIFDAVIIATDGFRIYQDKEKMKTIRKIAQEHGVIVLTDSDAAGFKIRNFLAGIVPKEKIQHAYIPQVVGKERRKKFSSRENLIGVEGFSREELLNCLRKQKVLCELDSKKIDLKTNVTDEQQKDCKKVTKKITSMDFFEDGLIGDSNCKEKRQKIKKELELPSYLSTKMLLKILNEAYEENKQMIDSEFEEYYSPKYKDIDYSVDVPIAESTEVIEIID